MECYLNTCLLLNNEAARSRLHNEMLQNLYSSPTNILHHRRKKGIDHRNICFMDVRSSTFFWMIYCEGGGREDVVSMATCYRLTVRGLNPGDDEFFCFSPDRPWSLLTLLHNEYLVKSMRCNVLVDAGNRLEVKKDLAEVICLRQ